MSESEKSRPAHVLIATEGTYPYMVGGVSTWCDTLINGLESVRWHVLSITAGGLDRSALFEFPANVESVNHRELWSDSILPGSRPWARATCKNLPGDLALGLFGATSSMDSLARALVWCRENRHRLQAAFRSRSAWNHFLDVLEDFGKEAGIAFSQADAGEIYQTLYWVARAAAETTRDFPRSGILSPIDMHLVTAAGWAGIGSVVDKHFDPRPIVLAEHGVYVREAYLQSARNVHHSQAQRWASTRLARGLARLVYAHADVVAPVTIANGRWESHLGVADQAIRPIYNGVLVPPHTKPLPKKAVVVSVGRIDPLKDIKTALRAASVVLRTRPDVQFLHFGEPSEGNDEYAKACHELHADLELGDRFVFAGHTSDPFEAFAGSSMAMFSSISEGFPVAVLEAMASGRPVVATAVGGVPEALSGCGLTVRPGDYEGLAAGTLTLLNDPQLLQVLGERSYVKVRQQFGMAHCLQNYFDLISELTGCEMSPPSERAYPEMASELAPPAGDHGTEPSVADLGSYQQSGR